MKARIDWMGGRSLGQGRPLRLIDTHETEEREREANVVRRIYAEAAAGLGQYAIARKLNAEAVPLFSSGNQRGKPWGPRYIRSLLTAPAVRGTYIPCITGRDERGRLLLQPQAPVEGYYPAVVGPVTS